MYFWYGRFAISNYAWYLAIVHKLNNKISSRRDFCIFKYSHNWRQSQLKTVTTEDSLNWRQSQLKTVTTEDSHDWRQSQLKTVTTEDSHNWRQSQLKTVTAEIQFRSSENSYNWRQSQLKTITAEDGKAEVNFNWFHTEVLLVWRKLVLWYSITMYVYLPS